MTRRCLAMLVALGCATSDIPAPRPTSVEPGTGYGGTPTPVVIRGTGFAVRVTQPSTGGSPTVDSAYRAWLGGVELADVVRVDSQTLQATVPAGLPSGIHALAVEGPFGRRGSLEGAFLVSWLPGAVLRATASLPSTASVGQTLRLTLGVANEGTTDAEEVTPGLPAPSSADGAAVEPVDGPSPPVIPSLRPGQTATFAWSWRATAPGALSLDVRASGRDAFSGQTVEVVPPAPARTTVQRPPALSATLGVPSTVEPGSDFAVTMIVSNAGEAGALGVSPAALALEPGSAPAAPRYGPNPPAADVPGGGGPATFVWIYSAGETPGAVQLSGEAAGRDANSGTPVTTGRVTSTAVTVGRAWLVADLAAAPATVAIGQPISLALRLVNPGSVAVRDIAPETPAVSGTGAATASAGPVPPSIALLGPGEIVTFTWTYTASAAGQLGFAVSATGTDAASGASTTATASLSRAVTIQGAPSLVVSEFAAVPNPAVVNQPIAVSLLLANGGTSVATISAVTPTASPSGGAACTIPSPALPATIAAGGTLRFGWTCTAAAAGSYTLGAAVLASDPGTGSDVSPAVPGLPVAVLGPARLAVSSFAANPNPAAVNQAVVVSLALANTGSAPASVTGASLQVSPPKATCTAAVPAPPQVIPAGGTTTFAWTCTSAAARSYTLSATVVASEAISGADISPAVPNITLKVE